MSEVASAAGTGDPVEDPEIASQSSDCDGDEVTPPLGVVPINRYLDICIYLLSSRMPHNAWFSSLMIPPHTCPKN